jgi:hypothetical protein
MLDFVGTFTQVSRTRPMWQESERAHVDFISPSHTRHEKIERTFIFKHDYLPFPSNMELKSLQCYSDHVFSGS